MKHPDVYVQVFLAHSFGYWYTNASDTFTASEATISSEDMIHPSFFAKSAEDRVDLSDKVYNLKAAFPDGRYIAEKLTQLTSNLPITSLLYTPASYFWMGIILTLLLTRKDRRYLVMLVPIAMLFLICCASPLNGSVRYALPIVFLTPVLFGWATTPNVVDQQTPFKSENKVKGIPPC